MSDVDFLNMTPQQLATAGATARANRGPDGRLDTGTTVMVQLKGLAAEEIGDFWVEAMIARIPENLRKSCPQHSGRDAHPTDYKTCTCAWVFRSQLIAALAIVKTNIDEMNARKAA